MAGASPRIRPGKGPPRALPGDRRALAVFLTCSRRVRAFHRDGRRSGVCFGDRWHVRAASRSRRSAGWLCDLVRGRPGGAKDGQRGALRSGANDSRAPYAPVWHVGRSEANRQWRRRSGADHGPRPLRPRRQRHRSLECRRRQTRDLESRPGQGGDSCPWKGPNRGLQKTEQGNKGTGTGTGVWNGAFRIRSPSFCSPVFRLFSTGQPACSPERSRARSSRTAGPPGVSSRCPLRPPGAPLWPGALGRSSAVG